MTTKESVMAAMDKEDQPSHSVDYYYLEAMRYLTCKDHNSDESDCECRRCRGGDDDDDDDNEGSLAGSDRMSRCNEDSSGRERSWSHSITETYDRDDKVSQLPDINKVGSRLKNRRFSDGMLLKSNMKVTNGHVQWADECHKELTRSRPRKKYERKPSLTTPPRKSILKHSSEESLPINDDDCDSCSSGS